MKRWGERIIDATAYSAVILMVLLTTLVTPPLLKWSLTSRRPPGKSDGP